MTFIRARGEYPRRVSFSSESLQILPSGVNKIKTAERSYFACKIPARDVERKRPNYFYLDEERQSGLARSLATNLPQLGLAIARSGAAALFNFSANDLSKGNAISNYTRGIYSLFIRYLARLSFSRCISARRKNGRPQLLCPSCLKKIHQRRVKASWTRALNRAVAN